MKYMRSPQGKVKPILDIYEGLHKAEGWVTLEGQDLKDFLMEQEYLAAQRVVWRRREGSVQARELTKNEKAAIEAWEKRLAEIEAAKAPVAAAVS